MEFLNFAARITAAYTASNRVPTSLLPEVVRDVTHVLRGLANGHAESTMGPARRPAVPAGQSVTPDCITCLDCGKRYRTLRRHLKAAHALSPEGYRRKWGLSADYPMVAPRYAEVRAAVARNIGLGRLGANHRRRAALARRSAA